MNIIKNSKEEDFLQWVNYFRSKQSDQINFIMGIVISLLFGIVTLTSNVHTATILGLLTYLILIIIILSYFFRRYKTYVLKETIALNQAGVKSSGLILEDPVLPRLLFYWFDNDWFVKFQDNLRSWRLKILEIIAPRSLIELIFYCIIWGGFVVTLLFWEVETVTFIRTFIRDLTKNLGIHAQGVCFVNFLKATFPALDWGPRHLYFVGVFILDITTRIISYLRKSRIIGRKINSVEIAHFFLKINGVSTEGLSKRKLGEIFKNDGGKFKLFHGLLKEGRINTEFDNLITGMLNCQVLKLTPDGTLLRSHNWMEKWRTFEKCYFILGRVPNWYLLFGKSKRIRNKLVERLDLQYDARLLKPI